MDPDPQTDKVLKDALVALAGDLVDVAVVVPFVQSIPHARRRAVELLRPMGRILPEAERIDELVIWGKSLRFVPAGDDQVEKLERDRVIVKGFSRALVLPEVWAELRQAEKRKRGLQRRGGRG